MHEQLREKPIATQKNRRWMHPTVVATGWASFFNDFSSEMIYPLLPIFLTAELGVGVMFVGLVEGLADSASSLVKLFSGWLSDKVRKRKLLVVLGYLLASVARPLMAAVTMGWQVLGLRFADRIGKGIRGAPRDALVADVTQETQRGLAFGYQRAMDHAGAIAGPLAATFILATFDPGYRALFALAALPAAVCLITVVVFIKEPKKNNVSSGDRPISALFTSWRAMDRRFKRLLLAMSLFALGNSSDAFLIVRARDLGVSLALIPIIWIVLHVSKSVLSIPGGVLSDRVGRPRTIVTGWLVYGLVYIGFAFSWSQWQAWALFATYGIYFALTEGVERAFVADVVTPEQRGIAFGQFNFLLGLTALPASLIFGALWEGLGFQAAFFLGAGLALLASLVLLAAGPAKPSPER